MVPQHRVSLQPWCWIYTMLHSKSFSILGIGCRTTVARMLARQAHDEHNPAQFIVTTFHPQVACSFPSL